MHAPSVTPQVLKQQIVDAAKRGERPRFHGNGIVQLYLQQERAASGCTETALDTFLPARRLHVWHPALRPTVTNSNIHDHRFDLWSRVLLGALRHTSYDVELKVEGETHALYEVVPAHVCKGDPYSLLPYGAKLTRREENVMAAGTEYFFAKRCFHRSDVELDALVMSVIEKGPDDKRFARVATVLGQEPDHAFKGDKPNEGVLWIAIHDAVERYAFEYSKREARHEERH